jgi:hypothetical protein
MADPIDRNISFRSLLRGEVDDFLRDEGLHCTATASAIVAVASRLATLREEGVPLWPEVYFSTDVDRLTAVLQGGETLRLGCGPHDDATVLRALKECAPLATGGWVIFVHRDSAEFSYGVLSATNLPLAITPYEALVENAVGDVTSVVVRRIAESCVELRGGRGHRRCLYFSDQRADAPSPAYAIERFSRAVTSDVPGDLRQDVFRYFYKVLSELLIEAHGALLVVQSHRRKKIPDLLRDSRVLPEPLSIADRVQEYRKHKDNEALAKLGSATSLLKGMLGSDGIIVFTTAASILAYRAFVASAQAGSTAASGGTGARGRVFAALRARVGKQFEAVFMSSQDGRTEFAGKENG